MDLKEARKIADTVGSFAHWNELYREAHGVLDHAVILRLDPASREADLKRMANMRDYIATRWMRGKEI